MSVVATEEQKLSIIRKRGATKEHLLRILLELQAVLPGNYIDSETAVLVAKELHMTDAKLYEVLTFYSMLKIKPQAKFVFKICNSSPCHFSKSSEVVSILEEELKIKIGETTEDGIFSFHYIPCAGMCEIGPIIKVKEIVYGNLDKAKIKQLIEDLKKEA